ncbi:MAG: SDR family oxidoreductase [Proteobacteria bacterium]|nr:SDR family oxidoreductase [Pseudomonadota bacterium]
MQDFRGKNVLITGASSGIGKAFAENLAARGSRLIITARSKDRLEELAQELRNKHNSSVDVIALDLSESFAASRLMKEIALRKLEVDVLINNAGFGKWAEFLSVDAATYNQMLQLNINALLELSQLCLPAMLKKGDGGIINVASTAAFVPMPYAAVYAASKAFVLSLSEALYGEYAPKGIQVTALCPGATESNFNQVALVPKSDASASVNATSTSAVVQDSAEFVAEIGLNAFLKGKCYVISGKLNFVTPWIPRLLSRKRVIKVIGNLWKRVLKIK